MPGYDRDPVEEFVMRSRLWLPMFLPAFVVLLSIEAVPAVPLPDDVSPAGTIHGSFVFDDVPPAAKAIDMSRDETGHCKKGPDNETTDPTWLVGAQRGVANVVVWVRAPRNTPFKLTEKDRVRKEPVVIRQPHCAFTPHVFAVYLTYYDAETGRQQKTGQILKVINDAPIPHNTNVEFGNPKLNAGRNELMVPARPERTVEMKFEDIRLGRDQRWGGEERIKITCNIHTWMRAHGWVFDHPFFAITQGGKKDDKAFGTFKIANVPVEMELDLVYWHESMTQPKVLQKVKLDRGKGLKIPDVKIK
jgi:hypothetical protein